MSAGKINGIEIFVEHAHVSRAVASSFEPRTGRKKFEGKVYYKAVGGPMLKRDNWPNGTPIRITKEAVAIEAAEQVRDWLIVKDLKKTN